VLARDRVLPVYPLSLVIRRFAGSGADPEWESFRRDVQGVEVHEQVHRRVQQGAVDADEHPLGKFTVELAGFRRNPGK